jgi:hypothetical protein
MKKVFSTIAINVAMNFIVLLAATAFSITQANGLAGNDIWGFETLLYMFFVASFSVITEGFGWLLAPQLGKLIKPAVKALMAKGIKESHIETFVSVALLFPLIGYVTFWSLSHFNFLIISPNPLEAYVLSLALGVMVNFDSRVRPRVVIVDL